VVKKSDVINSGSTPSVKKGIQIVAYCEKEMILYVTIKDKFKFTELHLHACQLSLTQTKTCRC